MRTPEEIQALRERAVELRQAGKSLREIRQILGPMSNATLHQALRGVPPPEWTRRPNAKDELRAQARELRGQGFDYEEIAAQLSVSKGSVSLWVRDLPVPERLSYEETRKRAAAGVQRYWEAERRVRGRQRAAERDAAAIEIGRLTDREILIAGAIAYWCEGAKSKPYRTSERVTFINSDPALIQFFLRFLQVAGVEPADLTFRVYIHERADAEEAERFWLEFTDEAYHGCLRIDVRHSTALYRKIDGWAGAAMSATRLGAIG
jgi:transposase